MGCNILNFLQTNSYCVEVAKTFGVKSAVLLSFLWGAGYSTKTSFSVSRDEIYRVTGLDERDQKDVESALSSSGVLTVTAVKGHKDKNYYVIDNTKFESITKSYGNNTEVASVEEKPKNKSSRATARQIACRHLKLVVNDLTDDQVLLQYLCDWIDAVYANPKNFLTEPGMKISYNNLCTFTADSDTKIGVLKIAIKNGWRDLDWAIEAYKRRNKEPAWKPYEDTTGRVQTENGAF